MGSRPRPRGVRLNPGSTEPAASVMHLPAVWTTPPREPATARREVPAREVSGRYPKCGCGGRWDRATAGAGTDVRAWWPACVDYTAAEVTA
jgi:hypothetical protein